MWGWAENLCCGFYRIWFGPPSTPISFTGLLGRAPEHRFRSLAQEQMLMVRAHEQMLLGLAHEHMLTGLAHEHMPMGLAHEHMLMEPDSGPNELKSRSGQHIRTSEFDQAK